MLSGSLVVTAVQKVRLKDFPENKNNFVSSGGSDIYQSGNMALSLVPEKYLPTFRD